MNNTDQEISTTRASTKRTLLFVVLGFTLSFGFVLALARMAFAIYNSDSDQIGGGVPLKLLGNSLVFAFPVSLATLFLINTKVKLLPIDTLKSFLSSIFVSMIACWVIFAMSGFVFGDIKLVKHFAILGAFIPPIGLLAGALLWQLRSMFGGRSL